MIRLPIRKIGDLTAPGGLRIGLSYFVNNRHFHALIALGILGANASSNFIGFYRVS